MVRIKLIVALLIFVQAGAQGQVNRYMIFFTDKQGNGYTINDSAQFLSKKANARRIKQNIAVIAEDLPVTPSYVQGVSATGATVLYKTKWMNGVLVECTTEQRSAIHALPFVKPADTEFVAPGGSGGARKKLNKLLRLDVGDDSTSDQLRMLGIDEMQADGYYGKGVTVAIMDGGFSGVNSNAPQSPFQELFTNRINTDASWNFVAHNPNVFQYSEHGTGVLSVIAVNTEGEFTGGAYQADFQLYVTENVSSEYRIEEYNWLFAAERADSAGADIINTSLGYNTFDDESMDYQREDMNGTTAVITRAAQVAASKGIFMVNSAGNSGTDASWRIITAPADGEDVLAVGNVNLQGIKSATSSIGPEGGRIKPDVAALGTGVSVYRANGNIGSSSGTSFSSPLTAALVAGLMQKYPTIKRKELMDAIRFSASRSPQPDNQLGYGIPHYRAVVNYLETKSKLSDRLLVIHPNPVKDTFVLSLTRPAEVQFNKITIVNVQGQVVAGSEVLYAWPDNTYSMDIRHFIPGVYFLTVRIGDKYETYKLVKI